MKRNNSLVAGAMALATAALAATATAAKQANAIEPSVVSCKLIKTAAQLQAMKNNLAASYCLARDIDLSSIANFQPIGDDTTPFTGKFFGNNHVVSNLTINSGQQRVGLFGTVLGATIRDMTLVNVDVAASVTVFDGSVGGLAGTIGGADIRDVSLRNVDIRAVSSEKVLDVGGLYGEGSSSPSSITRVSVTGKIKCRDGFGCTAGGVAGGAGVTTVVDSWSSADVTADAEAGGLVGSFSGSVSGSFATGNVTCTGSCTAGGLAGSSHGSVARSFATGSVSAPGFGVLGGLLGNNSGSPVAQSFATGSVAAGDSSFVGGLAGIAGGGSNVIDQCYAVGQVQGGAGAALGGLIGSVAAGVTATNSYWDTDTSGQAASAAGATGLTTVQLRARLRAGFDPAVWAITKTLSFPFLNDTGFDFTSPLATLVRANKVFTFLPIGQLDLSQYRFNPAHEANASLAAVYTMIARAIGTADNVAQLKNVKIDRYFWHDPRQTTTFTGPVTAHAALGVLKPLAANAKLTTANVIGKFNVQRLVILRGTFTKGNGRKGTHWMLGTLYTKGPGRRINAVVANDPWTGLQVAIDPVSKTVVAPANFPLADFKVNGYQPVLVH